MYKKKIPEQKELSEDSFFQQENLNLYIKRLQRWNIEVQNVENLVSDKS